MIAFWFLGIILIASAVWTISARKAVYSVVALLLNFAVLAVLYVTLSAEFLAVIQIIVYSGAILVLFVFVIALLSSGVAPFAMGPNRLPRIWLPAGILGLGRARLLDVRRFGRSRRDGAVERTRRHGRRLRQHRELRQSALYRCSCCRLKSPR